MVISSDQAILASTSGAPSRSDGWNRAETSVQIYQVRSNSKVAQNSPAHTVRIPAFKVMFGVKHFLVIMSACSRQRVPKRLKTIAWQRVAGSADQVSSTRRVYAFLLLALDSSAIPLH